jgi:hypothetical protein
MSIRIGLYDFFAYTIPGVFYILIIGFWLNAFQFVTLDGAALNNLPLFVLFIIVGAGYVTGLLLDPIAYRWLRLFRSRNRDAVKSSFESFCNRYKWLDVKFSASDWSLLLLTLKHKSIEVAMDVEQHNVASIMLRNISLGFLLFSLGSLTFFIGINANAWNFAIAVISLALSGIALRRSSLRREWFYVGIFEAFSAHYLAEGNLTAESLLGVNRINKTELRELNTTLSTPKSESESATKP